MKYGGSEGYVEFLCLIFISKQKVIASKIFAISWKISDPRFYFNAKVFM